MTLEFDKFWPEHSKISKNVHFNKLLLTKVNNVWDKESIEELFLIALNIDAKFEEKMTCAFKNCDFMGSFYPKDKIYRL